MRNPVLAAALVAASLPALAQSETRLLRYPDVSRTHVAFVYGGDLYVAGRNGGTAQRLTSHEGLELYPKFSPDGTRIAFSAEYAGTRQVYVMPAAGGTPQQLTYYTDVGPLPPRGGTDYRVLDWTPDGKHVVVRANRVPFDERGGRPYLVPADGGMERPMPMPEGGGGSLSPDGRQFAYTPIEADWRGWKRYRGGRAPDVWIYDLANDRARQLTSFRGMDMNPAWVGDTIYFASDRGTTLNLWAAPAAGGEAKRVTAFDDYDVLWTSGGPDAVVFEQGGYLWRYDHGAAEAVRVPIRVPTDAPYTLPAWKKVAPQIESFDLSPNGERAVFGARGEVFTLPAKHGEPRNVSRTPAARELSASWSPDGRWLAYLSDASGEYEIYVTAHDGRGEPRRVTTDGDIWRFAPVWSPDSKKLAYSDKKLRLRWVEVATGRTTDIDRADRNEIGEYTWSPDSRRLAYTKVDARGLSQVYVHELGTNGGRPLVESHANDSSPAWDPKGRYLYFVSNRDYGGLTFSAYEFNYLYTDATRLYAVHLSDDSPALMQPKLDEVEAAAPPADEAAKEAEAGGDEGPVRVRIEREGLADRVVALNVPPGQYGALSANATHVFFLAGNPQQGPLTLRTIALDGDKPEDVASGVTGYALSANGAKLLVRQAQDFAIVEAKPAQDPSKSKLALERMEARIDPRVEWRQQYVDAWRILRDWFYDEGLHGGRERWDAIRERYAGLVPHLAHRSDLDYILHELAGEANAGHVYVTSSTDVPGAARRPGGFLGAEVERDGAGWRITKILAGENFDPANRSPLTEPGVDVDEGDVILAVDGVPGDSVANFYALLENKAERVVTLRVADDDAGAGARDVLVRTIASERPLRYLEWVRSRRALVDRLSGGRIGYVHVPNTSTEGNRELMKWWPAIAHKDAILIDDRYNGGGFIPDRMIELVARRPLNYWKRRDMVPQPTPFLSHAGPKAMLVNGMSSSGGDAFPYYFRELGLGPIIGTRTWGGLIGISGNPSLADGGAILAATFRFMGPDGGWAVENEGVAPDIEVIDAPDALAAGRDPSIEKGVEVLLEALAREPPRAIEAPPAPQEFGGE